MWVKYKDIKLHNKTLDVRNITESLSWNQTNPRWMWRVMNLLIVILKESDSNISSFVLQHESIKVPRVQAAVWEVVFVHMRETFVHLLWGGHGMSPGFRLKHRFCFNWKQVQNTSNSPNLNEWTNGFYFIYKPRDARLHLPSPLHASYWILT